MIRILNKKYPCNNCVWFGAGNSKCDLSICWSCPHKIDDICFCNQPIPEGETECPYYEEIDNEND